MGWQLRTILTLHTRAIGTDIANVAETADRADLISSTYSGSAIQGIILDSYNVVVEHLHSSGDGLLPNGLFHQIDSVTGLDLLCVNTDNHQITWGVLGAALSALEDFMNEHQIYTAARFSIFDGIALVGVGSIA